MDSKHGQVDDDEVMMLREMLAQKSVEMSKREVDSKLTLRKCQREVESLRTENERYRIKVDKLETALQSASCSSSKSEPRAIVIIDSDDENGAPNVPLSPPLTNSNHSSTPEGAAAAHNRGDLVRNPKDIPLDAIEVKVKVGDSEDEVRCVPFVKREDGLLGMWDLDAFDLGPPVEVADKYNRGFSRKVISDAFGGNHQQCFHNWGTANAKGTPLATFNRNWNPQLPAIPGQHGVVFYALQRLHKSTNFNCPVLFFVGEGTNDWRLYGKYSTQHTGEISPAHISRLSPTVLSLWVREILRTDWGKRLVSNTNTELAEHARESGKEAVLVAQNDVGITAALNDGRLILNFIIMKCLSYQPEVFKTLVYYEKHPKPSGSGSPRKAKLRPRRVSGQDSEEVVTDTGSVDESEDDSQIEACKRKRRSQRTLRSKSGKRRKSGSEAEYVYHITDSESGAEQIGNCSVLAEE